MHQSISIPLVMRWYHVEADYIKSRISHSITTSTNRLGLEVTAREDVNQGADQGYRAWLVVLTNGPSEACFTMTGTSSVFCQTNPSSVSEESRPWQRGVREKSSRDDDHDDENTSLEGDSKLQSECKVRQAGRRHRPGGGTVLGPPPAVWSG